MPYVLSCPTCSYVCYVHMLYMCSIWLWYHNTNYITSITWLMGSTWPRDLLSLIALVPFVLWVSSILTCPTLLHTFVVLHGPHCYTPSWSYMAHIVTYLRVLHAPHCYIPSSLTCPTLLHNFVVFFTLNKTAEKFCSFCFVCYIAGLVIFSYLNNFPNWHYC